LPPVVLLSYLTYGTVVLLSYLSYAAVKRKNSFAKKIVKEKPFIKDFQFSSIKQLSNYVN